MIMKKRGLSDVVTTVLLILLVLAAVIIVWAFVRVFILDNSAKIDTGVFNVGFSIPSKNVVITEDNNITFKLTRSAGEAELEAVNVIIEDNEGNRVVKRIDGSINELGSKTIIILRFEHNLTSIKRIAVAPIVLNKDGNEIIGNEVVSYKIKGDEEGSILTLPASSCTGSETQSCSGSNECKNYQQTCSAGTWGTCIELGNKIDGTSCSIGVCVVGSCVSAPTDYIAYWAFENDFIDNSGNGHEGTGQGGVGFAAGKLDQGASFDGINDRIEIPHTGSINLGADGSKFSISLWFKTSGNVGVWADHLIGKASDTSNLPNPLGVSLQLDNKISFSSNEAGRAHTATSTLAYNDNSWHHIVGVRDDNDLYLYLDGILVASNTGGSIGDTRSSSPLQIGTYTTGAVSGEWFNGKIDDVKIYNRVVNANEVSSIYYS